MSEPELINDLQLLCATPPPNNEKSLVILNLIQELITPEIHLIPLETQTIISTLITQSKAFNNDIEKSWQFVTNTLLQTDILDFSNIDYSGLLLFQAPSAARYCLECIESSEITCKIANVVFTYRFTKPQIVYKYLVFFEKIVRNSSINQELINQHLLAYLISSLQTELCTPALNLLVSLTNQFESMVYTALVRTSSSNTSVGNLAVMKLNREHDLKLKGLVCKFCQLVLAADLFYTNDLTVLLEIISREIGEQGENVQTEFLQLLYEILIKPDCEISMELKTSISKGLHNTKTELAERCLQSRHFQIKRRPPPPPPRIKAKPQLLVRR